MTPVTAAKSHRAQYYVKFISQSAQLCACQRKRQVAIEPIFGLLGQLLSTHNNKKTIAGQSKSKCIYFFDAWCGFASTGNVGQFYLGKTPQRCDSFDYIISVAGFMSTPQLIEGCS